MKISIITVSYNSVNFIEDTIQSVLFQTYTDIEYIIIDGGSTDGTVDIIKKYADKLTFWVSEPDNGIYSAMNKGIEKITGEWVSFMNAGDKFVNENILCEVFKDIHLIKCDVIFGNTVVYNEKRGKAIKVFAEESSEKKPMSFGHQSVFVRSELTKRFPFDENYKICADKDLFCKLRKINSIFCNSDKFISEIQMVGFSNKNRLKNLLEVNAIYTHYGIRTRNQELFYKFKAYLEDFFLAIIKKLHLYA